MNIHRFMERGITTLWRTASRFYGGDVAGRRFLAQLLPAQRNSARLRDAHKEAGRPIPPFLIASIASACNLRCSGCYARAGGACAPPHGERDMSAAEWERVFAEASSLGVSFILLAGGEPLMRPDVLALAARFPHILFPVFTNGTLIDREQLDLFDRCRNLIPVLSLEGDAADTDARRGPGTHDRVTSVMADLGARNILYGISLTVHRKNLRRLASSGYVETLRAAGCGLLFYVEYVPAEAGTEHLALTPAEAFSLQTFLTGAKKRFRDLILIAFPGDEEAMGGCLASGRGFFHINPQGGAEPCPFSPHAKDSLRNTSILDVLASDYFVDLRTLAQSAGGHAGGCTLFALDEQVQGLLAN